MEGQRTTKILELRKDHYYEIRYEGEVNDMDEPHGMGKFIHKSYRSNESYTYEGEFRNGKRHGRGVLIEGHAPYEDRYEGEWENDMRDGYGIQVYYYGAVYEGQWKRNKHHGYGVLKEKDGTVYEGEIFDMGMISGRGKITYPNGETYEGDIKGAKRHGHGVMTYQDGRVVDRQWLNDMSFDEDLLIRTAEFTPERIKDFCVKEASGTHEYRDLDVVEGHSDAGFAIDGKIHGFMWRRDWDDGPGSADYYYCGLVDDQLKKIGFICSIRYQPDRPFYGFMETEYMLPGLLERNGGRIVFCGVHKDGVRHGLGSEFSYGIDGKITELQGLWQNGKLTHRREGDQLVPVE